MNQRANMPLFCITALTLQGGRMDLKKNILTHARIHIFFTQQKTSWTGPIGKGE